MNTNVIIIGSSGHAKVIIDIIEKQNQYTIVGLVDSFRLIGEDTLGYKIIGKEEDLLQIAEKYNCSNFFVAIGDNWIRHKVVDRLLRIKPDISFIIAIHPSAQIAKGVSIGEGTAIMAGAIINSSSRISRFAIINTNASVDHDCMLGDYVSLAPNVTIGGGVRVGDFTGVSISATLKHKIVVGNHTIIGAGAVVLADVGDNIVAYGVPAKIIREREIGEKYL